MKPENRFDRVLSFALLILTAAIIFFPQAAFAGTVSLAWDPNTQPELAGYLVYFGTASRTYGAPLDVGNVTSYTIANLPNGTYYFAVKAHSLSGELSDFSNEVSATLGTPAIGCDINGDNSVNVVDLQALANVILGIGPATGSDDLSRDGKVDVVDLQILINVILGLRSCP